MCLIAGAAAAGPPRPGPMPVLPGQPAIRLSGCIARPVGGGCWVTWVLLPRAAALAGRQPGRPLGGRASPFQAGRRDRAGPGPEQTAGQSMWRRCTQSMWRRCGVTVHVA